LLRRRQFHSRYDRHRLLNSIAFPGDPQKKINEIPILRIRQRRIQSLENSGAHGAD
jgi:hypothetical protein